MSVGPRLRPRPELRADLRTRVQDCVERAPSSVRLRVAALRHAVRRLLCIAPGLLPGVVADGEGIILDHGLGVVHDLDCAGRPKINSVRGHGDLLLRNLHRTGPALSVAFLGPLPQRLGRRFLLLLRRGLGRAFRRVALLHSGIGTGGT